MNRIFNGMPDLTPEDVMKHRLEIGEIKLSEFMEWLVGDKTWDSVKESVKQKMIDNTKLQ